MSKETARILRKAKKRLAGRWAQHALAKTPTGDVVPGPIKSTKPGESKNTCLVCARGAINWAIAGDPTCDFQWLLTDDQVDLRAQALDALSAALPRTSSSVVAFNDWNRRIEPDVLALFDRAIEAEEVSA